MALKMKDSISERAKKNSLANLNNVDRQKSAHRGKTNEQLATIAGVSRDTINKVEKIEEKATPRTKQLLREGKLSINQAYNSVHPKKEEEQNGKI